MLDKIKGYLLYLVLPITALFGFIWKLMQDNRQLRDAAAREEINNLLKEQLGDLKDAKETADQAERKYIDAKLDYDTVRKSGVSDDSGEVR